MSDVLEQELKERANSLKHWADWGFAPYPAKFKCTTTASEVRETDSANLPELDVNNPPSGNEHSLAGRLMTIREHGQLIFGTLQDQSGKVQVAFLENVLTPKLWQLAKSFHMGDIVGVTGPVVQTKRGEITILARQIEPLAKALRPLPEKWHGLKDIEMRLRQRYVDLMMSAETRDLFIKKAIFWKTSREVLSEAGFIEVDTPALEAVAGGADANPFVTHHDALDQNFYLRISLELPLKRLLVGGFEKVYEIGKVFRNEGIDTEHLQDYDMCEFYWAYADYSDLMSFTQILYQRIVRAITGGLKTTYDGKEIDWSGEWPREDYFKLIEKHSGVNLVGITDVEKLRKILRENKIRYDESMGPGRLIDLFWKKSVRPHIQGPLFLINHPVEVSPLAKRHANDFKRVQRMQIIVAGSELGNGFSELNDPADQKARFEEQAKLRAAGDSEAMMLDEDFITALEYGMPPAAGFGFSERLFSFIVDKPIRETVLFPPMRSK